MENLINAKSETSGHSGVTSESNLFEAVHGISHAGDGHGAIVGINDNATPSAGPGVQGKSRGTGVWGESETWMGVFGFSKSTTGGAGVMGQAEGPGVIGVSKTWHGVYGETPSKVGGAGVWGEHKGNGNGVVGNSIGTGAGVIGISKAGIGIHGKGGRLAGFFEGNVEVTGDIKLTGGNDVAESFSVINTDLVAPGCVMIFGEDGSIEACHQSYDKKVAGVISGAGDYKPGLLLGKEETEADHMPIALVGKVFCWVDADFGPVEVGDLLTTSSTHGHAMKAQDPLKAFGSVIGKALMPLMEGKGLIPILVALQ
jgi:hypothetical protein